MELLLGAIASLALAILLRLVRLYEAVRRIEDRLGDGAEREREGAREGAGEDERH